VTSASTKSTLDGETQAEREEVVTSSGHAGRAVENRRSTLPCRDSRGGAGDTHLASERSQDLRPVEPSLPTGTDRPDPDTTFDRPSATLNDIRIVETGMDGALVRPKRRRRVIAWSTSFL
jgi:hypothetical protein